MKSYTMVSNPKRPRRQPPPWVDEGVTPRPMRVITRDCEFEMPFIRERGKFLDLAWRDSRGWHEAEVVRKAVKEVVR